MYALGVHFSAPRTTRSAVLQPAVQLRHALPQLLASCLLLGLRATAVPVVRRNTASVSISPNGFTEVVRKVKSPPSGSHLSLQQVMTCPNGSPASQTQCLSQTDYNQIVDQLTKIMQDLKTNSPCTNDVCKLADFAGCTLRAAGHDFMDLRNGVGGSDGCLRFDDPDNKGLINCLRGDFDMNGDTDPDMFNKTLHDVYKNFCDVVSLADFIVIAGEAVMGFTATSTTVNLKQLFKDEFMYGRTTRQTCENAVALPNPFDGCAANEVTFLAHNAFSFTWRETAALMGVHTLGKATLENSGYSGWWQDEHNVARFNNNYYISIVNHGWGPAKKSSGKFQWDRVDSMHDQGGNHPEMMLNTDMCLVYKDLKAESSNCCAWERFAELTRLNVRENTSDEDNVEIYCGFKNPHVAGFGQERGWCCLGESASMPDCAPTAAPLNGMVGNNLVPEGPATNAVHEFAANEDLWLGEFAGVWKIATGKTFESDLRALEQKCLKPTPAPTTAAPTTAAPTTAAPTTATPTTAAPTTGAPAHHCEVTVYEHWPEGISEAMAQSSSTRMQIGLSNWSPTFPTGQTKLLRGTGNFTLDALSGVVSSVKVIGNCCKAYGYTDTSCSSGSPSPISSETLVESVLGAGVVAPASNLKLLWGCNDCAMCVKVERQC